MSKFRKLLVFFVLGCGVLVITAGCSTVGYYGQSVVGHTRLMLARQDIDKAIKTTNDKQRQQLLLAKEMRKFAVTDLSLPDNSSYLSYVDLKREYPVWSVVAAPEFSLKPRRWCYPVIGCAAYRGYFSESAAEKYAQKLQKEGLETHVGGATAYSTLGWFSDPLIPSMMRNGNMFLAQVMFHELAHQELYIKGNSAFNEAFATVVGEHGTLLWLKQADPNNLDSYQTLMRVRNDFSGLIKRLKSTLKKHYDADLLDKEKRAKKSELIANFRKEYEKLIAEKWQGKRWYSSWVKNDPNNARLAAFSTYRDLVPEFENLLVTCENDFSRFYQVVAKQQGKGRNATVATHCD